MANQDIETLIRSLDKVFYTLDELGSLNHCLDALNIISEHLSNFALSDYCKRSNHSKVELSHHVATQIEMISDYSNRARDILRAYEDKLTSKIDESQSLLSKISLESSDSNLSTSVTNSNLETCDNFTVDNSNLSSYYYY